MKPEQAITNRKKTQTYVLRIWERAEGTRYELRSPSGECKIFKTFSELEVYVNTPQKSGNS